MTRMLFVCLFLLFEWCAQAQSEAGLISRSGATAFSAIASQDPRPRGDFTSLELPLIRIGKLLAIEATVDSLKGNFIIDTGAPYLILHRTYFRHYPNMEELKAGGVNVATSEVFRTKVGRLEMGACSFRNLEADVTDLGAIENKRGVRIFGLIGLNIFKSFEVCFDLNRNVLILKKLNKRGKPIDKKVATKKLLCETNFRIENEVLLFDAMLENEKLLFSFDSGAEMNLLHNQLPERIIANFEVERIMKLQGVMGTSEDALAGWLPELVINGTKFARMHTLMTNLCTMQDCYGLQIHGMIGYELMLKGEVTFNFKTKRMVIFEY